MFPRNSCNRHIVRYPEQQREQESINNINNTVTDFEKNYLFDKI